MMISTLNRLVVGQHLLREIENGKWSWGSASFKSELLDYVKSSYDL